MCLACTSAGFFSGFIASQLGLSTPKAKKFKRISIALTTLTTSLAVIILKTCFQYSPCPRSGSLLYQFSIASLKIMPFALINGIAMNHFVAFMEDRWLNKNLKNQEIKSCCAS